LCFQENLLDAQALVAYETDSHSRKGVIVSMTIAFADPVPTPVRCARLGEARRGFCGRIDGICAAGCGSAIAAAELESRLIELGFVEGALIEVLHEGTFGRDPIAVRVNDATIALRRREAMAILVT
jgi:ferrous iron transport protein A